MQYESLVIARVNTFWVIEYKIARHRKDNFAHQNRLLFLTRANMNSAYIPLALIVFISFVLGQLSEEFDNPPVEYRPKFRYWYVLYPLCGIQKLKV